MFYFANHYALNAMKNMTNKPIILHLFLAAFLMCMAGISFAQHTADTLHNIDEMKAVSPRGDTAILAIDNPNMRELSPEIIMSILRHGTTNVYEEYLFSPLSAQYPMMQQPGMPYRNNIDGAMESIQKSLNEYYKKYHQGQTTGEVLNYLSFLCTIIGIVAL
jgi:hypothetical protein